MTITEFLLARIAEDEAVAGPPDTWSEHERGGPQWAEVGAISEVLMIGEDRVWREAQAKRAIVEAAMEEPPTGANLTDYMRGIWAARHAVLYPLASVYADHPDYQQEWAA